jgi:hypothetical protein
MSKSSMLSLICPYRVKAIVPATVGAGSGTPLGPGDAVAAGDAETAASLHVAEDVLDAVLLEPPQAGSVRRARGSTAQLKPSDSPFMTPLSPISPGPDDAGAAAGRVHRNPVILRPASVRPATRTEVLIRSGRLVGYLAAA